LRKHPTGQECKRDDYLPGSAQIKANLGAIHELGTMKHINL
jgi:hypothetical protein